MMNSPVQELKTVHRFPEIRPSAAPSDHGWLHEHNQEVLRRALGEQTSVAVELGSWCGLSTRFIAEQAPNAVVVAIDHWKGSPEMVDFPECVARLPALYETFLSSCWAYRDRIVPLRMETTHGMNLVHSLGIRPDLVYVDAGHLTEAVKLDVRIARRLFPHAELVGDDIHWESVRVALGDLLREGILDAVDFKTNCWWRPTPRLSGISRTSHFSG